MIRLSLLAILLSFLCVNSFCQADSIKATKTFGGYKFEQNGQPLNPKALLNLMTDEKEAHALMKKAKSNYDLASVIGFSGGFLVGWPLGTAIAGGEPNWILAGVGAGLIILAIPVSNAANQKALKAVELYNSKIQSTSFHNGFRLDLGFTTSGIGMTFTF